MNYNEKNVGIIGYWFATNYGGVASYYSLYKTIEKYGYFPFLVETPYLYTDKEGIDVFSRNFFKEMGMQISECYTNQELEQLNRLTDMFVLGSDQVLTSASIRIFGKLFLMEFADDTKRKIAISASCGGDNLNADINSVKYAAEQLKRFNAISVREISAVDIVKDKFGIDTEMVPDPIIMSSADEYKKIAEKKNILNDENYLLAYILDPTDDKRKLITEMEEHLGLKVKIILDGRKNTYEKNYKLMDMPEKTLKELDFYEWVAYFVGAKYVITDSYHGAVMSLVLNKPFISYVNYTRGYPRFATLAQMFDIDSRLVKQSSEVSRELLDEKIEYEQINKKLIEYREKIEIWLKKALVSNKKVKVEKKIMERKWDPDFERCRMVASLLKQYGIKHVVLSSGTRNLNLCRFFEKNPWFITHKVIDERSAAFYGIGLGLELKETVAICCTSGTAASNYLTGVTEAYYQNVPLVVITADRYPCYLGQMEDQTIPQNNMFAEVCKKSVTLPVNTGLLADWETRRKIAEALLEVNHHGSGPVHINVPIQNITRVSQPQNEFFLWNYRFINRLELKNDVLSWANYAIKLKNARRILIVYGQNAPKSENEKRIIESFCEKYGSVIVTDHLSNFHSKYAIQSFPILKDMSQKEFNEELAPEIVITVGGKRMLNDPITFKLRDMKEDYEHWRITEDGKVVDMFRRLSTIFECSQEYFFDFYSKQNVQENQDWSYFNLWTKKAEEKKNANHIENYQMKYILENFMKNVPSGSLLHIAIGNTIMFSNIYPLNEGVEVYCNMGTNGIDGCASTYMGHVAATDKKAYLIIGDLSFFYDMNSVFNKKLKPNIRIFMTNNNGAGLLRDLQSPAITHEHYVSAKEYVRSLGFRYLSATNKEEYEEQLKLFFSDEINEPVFFEVFTN